MLIFYFVYLLFNCFTNTLNIKDVLESTPFFHFIIIIINDNSGIFMFNNRNNNIVNTNLSDLYDETRTTY